MLTDRYISLLVSTMLCIAIVGCATTNDNYEILSLKASAEQGDMVAQRKLGIRYYEGKGIPKNYSEAAKWFRLSAEQGDASGQILLGGMYYYGKGVIQNKVHAYMWWNISASLGNEISVKARDKFAKFMTQSQLEEAQRLARACVKKNYKGCLKMTPPKAK